MREICWGCREQYKTEAGNQYDQNTIHKYMTFQNNESIISVKRTEKMDMLVLFLTLEEMLSGFEYLIYNWK